MGEDDDCEGSVVFAEVYPPKVAAILSIIGSVLIIAEVVKDMRSSRGSTATSRILLSMSVGDILYSL